MLAVDIDPQASLTTLFGYQPEVDFLETGTIFDAIRYDAPLPLREIIQQTYFANLDLAPGGLILQEFEHETPQALINNVQPAFFSRMAAALEEVETDYDVIIFDCPPQLGYLTMSALCASTGVIITVVPNMLDIASMSQFLQMSAELLDVVSNAGASLEFRLPAVLDQPLRAERRPAATGGCISAAIVRRRSHGRTDAEVHRDFRCRPDPANGL